MLTVFTHDVWQYLIQELEDVSVDLLKIGAGTHHDLLDCLIFSNLAFLICFANSSCSAKVKSPSLSIPRTSVGCSIKASALRYALSSVSRDIMCIQLPCDSNVTIAIKSLHKFSLLGTANRTEQRSMLRKAENLPRSSCPFWGPRIGGLRTWQ